MKRLPHKKIIVYELWYQVFVGTSHIADKTAHSLPSCNVCMSYDFQCIDIVSLNPVNFIVSMPRSSNKYIFHIFYFRRPGCKDML